MERLRFAPSPTGHLHIGNLRTAVFNWLVARQTGGFFVLRIEDTDFERSDTNYETSHFEALRWLRLTYDEGPNVGGDYGPYRQSERLHQYHRTVDQLLEEAKAYRCFCTKEELDAERVSQAAQKKPPRYSRKCLGLPPAAVRENLEKKTAFTVRFRVPEGPPVQWRDRVKGDLSFDRKDSEDFILLKSDGMPSFHLANVVDDAAMKITRVIRGEDHVTNTAKHRLLFEALGVPPPEYGHLPLLRVEGGGKMSKREGDYSWLLLRDEGILPEALVNYLARLGWTPPANVSEILSVPEIIAAFRLDEVSQASPQFSETKLKWFNRRHLRALTDKRLEMALGEYPGGARLLATLNHEQKAYALQLIRENAKTLKDAVALLKFLEPAPLHFVDDPDEKSGFDRLAYLLGRRDLPTIEATKEFVAHYPAPAGDAKKKWFHDLRLILTGSGVGLDLPSILFLLGRDESVCRVHKAIRWNEGLQA
ncbi:MAG: glutamate--tRNA ligase [bacterium]